MRGIHTLESSMRVNTVIIILITIYIYLLYQHCALWHLYTLQLKHEFLVKYYNALASILLQEMMNGEEHATPGRKKGFLRTFKDKIHKGKSMGIQ